MSLIDVRNRAQCLLTEDITSTQTRLPVGPGSTDFLPATGHRTLAVLRDATGVELVSISAVDPGYVTVERGQDGTTARSFKAGALMAMRIVKGTFPQYIQKGTMRQVSYNPNIVLLPTYFGEKVAETGVDGCQRRIWQNVKENIASWRIVYGDMCSVFTGYRDWNWDEIIIPWGEWPSPATDMCGWTMALYEFVDDPSKHIVAAFRACLAAASQGTGDVDIVTDYSGNSASMINEGAIYYCQNCTTASINGDVDAYYRFVTGDVGVYYWGEASYGSQTSDKYYYECSTDFFVVRINMHENGGYEGRATLDLGGRFYAEIWTDGLLRIDDPYNQSTPGNYDISGFPQNEWVVVTCRVKSDGNLDVRLNGASIGSHTFGPLTPVEVGAGRFISVEAPSSVIHFDLKSWFSFISAFSDEDVEFFEGALMGIHGIDA